MSAAADSAPSLPQPPASAAAISSPQAKRKQPDAVTMSAASSDATVAPPAAAAAAQSAGGHAQLSEEERAAKRARREERKAAVAALEEQVTPLYPGYPECRVLIYNVAKKQNVGTIVRTAVAFAATQIIVVGNRKLNTLGNQATNRYIAWRHFEKWPECLAWVRASGFKLVGVEIGERAKNIATRPFSDKTIFILGNEGQGLSQETMDACDELVYIPQYGRGTASLNVATAASIVLHHFAEYAKYPEHAPITGAKFDVDPTKARIDQGLALVQREGDAAGPPASSTAAEADDGDNADGDGGD